MVVIEWSARAGNVTCAPDIGFKHGKPPLSGPFSGGVSTAHKKNVLAYFGGLNEIIVYKIFKLDFFFYPEPLKGSFGFRLHD